MSASDRRLAALFAVLMLGFCLLLFVWVPLKSILDFRLSEARLSLETSQGRERKQQYEYDEVVAALPEARAQLTELQPRSDAAAQDVADLKALRKELRAEKKRREPLRAAAAEAAPEEAVPPAQPTATPSEEEAGHE